MALKDITPLRPWYLSSTLIRDYHYAVFNAEGERVLVLVTLAGEKSSFYVPEPIQYVHKVVYENRVEIARLCLARYTLECTDLFDTLRHYNNPPGKYGMSVLDASGKRLYTFSFTLT
jgi:hypothetical protein